MGRPSSWTPKIGLTLGTWLRAGNPIPTACKASGISESTFHAWMERGAAVEAAREAGEDVDPGEERFEAFREEITRAMDETEAALVAMVARTAQRGNGWQAAAWLLERRWPERWGKPMERANGVGQLARDTAPAPAVDPFDALADQTDELAARRRPA